MKKIYTNILFMIVVGLVCLTIVACGVVEVRGKTFRYSKVEIDWGSANQEDKESLFEEFLVQNETELLNVLKTRNNRNSRITTFNTDGTYVTKNTDGDILDSGYYRQDDSIVTLADTKDDLSQDGAYTLQVNEDGYIVIVKLNDDNNIFARYLYTSN